MITDINSEDRLVQATFAEHLQKVLGWESIYAWNQETFGPIGTLGRADTREVVLTRDLRVALTRLNPQLPGVAVDGAVSKLTRHDFSRSLLQHSQEFYQFVRDGVPVSYRDAQGQRRHAQAPAIDFQNGRTNGQPNNRFLVVRELKLTGLRAVYRNIHSGFDGNLRDYLDETSSLTPSTTTQSSSSATATALATARLPAPLFACRRCRQRRKSHPGQGTRLPA